MPQSGTKQAPKSMKKASGGNFKLTNCLCYKYRENWGLKSPIKSCILLLTQYGSKIP